MVRLLPHVLAVAAWASLTTPPDSADEEVPGLMLLQAEVRTKQRASTPPSRHVEEGRGTSPGEICESSERLPEQAELAYEELADEDSDMELLHAEAELAAAELANEDGELASRKQRVERLAAIFRAMLMFGTALVVLDGINRWLSPSKDGDGDGEGGCEEPTLAEVAREGGADVRSRATGAAPLVAAARAGGVEACAGLLDPWLLHAAGADVDAQDDEARAPIVAAGAMGEKELRAFFLDGGDKVSELPACDVPSVLREARYWQGLSQER